MLDNCGEPQNFNLARGKESAKDDDDPPRVCAIYSSRHSVHTSNGAKRQVVACLKAGWGSGSEKIIVEVDGGISVDISGYKIAEIFYTEFYDNELVPAAQPSKP